MASRLTTSNVNLAKLNELDPRVQAQRAMARQVALEKAEAERVERAKQIYIDALREANHAIDRREKPENIATYQAAMAVRPGGPCTDSYCMCMESYAVRLQDGYFPPGFDIDQECRRRLALVHPPKGPIWNQVGDALSDLGDVLTDIPVLGDILSIASQAYMGPYRIAKGIVEGENIGDVMIAHFEAELKVIKVAGPYLQTVLSFFPGIGTAMSAAIGFAAAVAGGQPITDALIAGVKGALPGGPLAVAAFSIGEGVISGKPIEEIGINALPIPQTAKDLLKSGAAITRSLAEGKPLEGALLNAALTNLPNAGKLAEKIAEGIGADKILDDVMKEAAKIMPPDIAKTVGDAFAVGITVTQGRVFQDLTKMAIESKPFHDLMRTEGQKLIGNNVIAAAAYNQLENAEYKKGFEVGYAMTRYALTSHEFIAGRQAMFSEAARTGYDMGSALRIGQARQAKLERSMTKITIPPTALPAVQAGSMLTRGMVGSTSAQKAAMMSIVAKAPDMRLGAVAEVKQIATERVGNPNVSKKTIWEAILDFFGLYEEESFPVLPAPKPAAVAAFVAAGDKPATVKKLMTMKTMKL